VKLASFGSTDQWAERGEVQSDVQFIAGSSLYCLSLYYSVINSISRRHYFCAIHMLFPHYRHAIGLLSRTLSRFVLTS
jgi:hypothetical protein